MINDLFLQRSFAFYWLGIIFFPLFAVLDYFTVREHFSNFLFYRLCLAFILFVFLLIQRRKNSPRITQLLLFVAYLLGGFTITLMVLQTGGYSSSYYVGLLLISVGCFSLLPLTAKQAAFAGFALYCVYVIPLLMFCQADKENIRIFFNNSFFFVSIVIVSLVECNEEIKARIRKFKLNVKLKSMNKDLTFYSSNLESEVDKRMKKIKESKLRYKELYENIMDPLVVINDKAEIEVANQHFYMMTKQSPINAKGVTFLDIVHPVSRSSVAEKMLPPLLQGRQVRDFQFIMRTGPKKQIPVECNAKQISKKGESIGFQLVIRDISERKRMEKQLLESYNLVDKSRTTAILALAKLAEFRDRDTGDHLKRIREYSKILAEQLGLHPHYENYITRRYIEDIYLSSILHDIGKIGIPDSILLKPAKLTDEEFQLMKCHCVYGGDTLAECEKQTSGQSFLTLGKQIAYHHHEKLNGTGYPFGLKGDEIPLSARIVALADVYDALTSKRSYKPPFSHEHTKELIVTDRGTHFDPDVVDAFLAREDDFKKMRIHILTN